MTSLVIHKDPLGVPLPCPTLPYTTPPTPAAFCASAPQSPLQSLCLCLRLYFSPPHPIHLYSPHPRDNRAEARPAPPLRRPASPPFRGPSCASPLRPPRPNVCKHFVGPVAVRSGPVWPEGRGSELVRARGPIERDGTPLLSNPSLALPRPVLSPLLDGKNKVK